MTRAAAIAAILALLAVAWYYRQPVVEPLPWQEDDDGVPAWDTYQAAVLARR